MAAPHVIEPTTPQAEGASGRASGNRADQRLRRMVQVAAPQAIGPTTPQAEGASGRPRRAGQSKELTPQAISEQGLHRQFGKQSKQLTDDVSINDQETFQADKHQDSKKLKP